MHFTQLENCYKMSTIGYNVIFYTQSANTNNYNMKTEKIIFLLFKGTQEYKIHTSEK